VDPTDAVTDGVAQQRDDLGLVEEEAGLVLPKNGLPTIAIRAPIPATRARLLPGARSIPTSELIFSASVTGKGASSTRMVDMYAAVQRAMKTHPTRSAAAGAGGETSVITVPWGDT